MDSRKKGIMKVESPDVCKRGHCDWEAFACYPGNKRCRPCQRALARDYYERTRTKDLDRGRLRRFGPGSVEYFNNRLLEQDGRCAICACVLVVYGRGKTKSTAHLDHDHTTGKLRAVLCTTCNGGLGSFYDRADLLEKANRYLQLWAI